MARHAAAAADVQSFRVSLSTWLAYRLPVYNRLSTHGIFAGELQLLLPNTE